MIVLSAVMFSVILILVLDIRRIISYNNEKKINQDHFDFSKKDFDGNIANAHLNHLILCIIDVEIPLMQNKINQFSKNIKYTKYINWTISIILIFIGISFLIITFSIIIMYYFDLMDSILGALGFGSISSGSFISLLITKPTNRIQESNSDACQAEVIFYCWKIGIILYIQAMNITERESIKEAVQNIKELTIKSVELIDKHYEHIK